MKNIFCLTLASLALASCVKEQKVTITVENKSSMSRNSEMVEVDWNLVKNNLKLTQEQQIVVLDEMGQQVPYQLVSYGSEMPQMLIFQTTLSANQALNYKVTAGTPEAFKDMVETTFVPRRKDDISWENDRVAFRMYGPALEDELVSGGIDLWVKSTPNLVTQRWYTDELDKGISYHEDHGEGLDFYSVGRTLGCGSAAPYCGDSLAYITSNFKSYEILDNGPLRTVFKLTYAPYDACGQIVNETRLISLDAGSNLNKIVENYGDVSKSFHVAAGFPYYDNQSYVSNDQEGYVSYALPANPEHGVVYQGLVSDAPIVETKVFNQQLIAVLNYDPSYLAGKGLTYYSGGGWSKGGFATTEEWNAYVANFAACIRNPLVVSVR